jgi:MoaA/NifB/PqqE/SkfB family radical SAM enzyme
MLISKKRKALDYYPILTFPKNKILKPNFVSIIIKDECFFKCKMCYSWKTHLTHNKETKFIETNDIKTFLIDLSKFADKGLQINFAGGEPFLHKDLLEIIKFSNELGFRTNIATNGWMLTKKVCKTIIESNLSIIVFSIDGLNNIHDEIRGQKNSFQRIENAILYLSELRKNNNSNIKINIQSVLSELNFDHIIEYIKYFDNNNEIDTIHINAVSEPNNTVHDPFWYRNEFSNLWPKKPDKIIKVIDKIIEIKKKGSKLTGNIQKYFDMKNYFLRPEVFAKNECDFDKSITLTSTGDLYMCNYYKSFGNIKKQKLADAWNSYIAFKTRRVIKSCTKNCHELLNCG